MINLQYTPYILPLVAAAFVSVVLAVAIWRRRPGAGVVPFLVLMAGVTEWCTANVLEMSATGLHSKTFFSGLSYIGITTATAAWLAFALEYTGREKWLSRRNVLLLTIQPVIVVILSITSPYTHFFRYNFALDDSGPFLALKVTFGWGFWVHAVYSYVLLLVGNTLLIQAFIRSPKLYRNQVAALLIGAFAPWIANAIFIFNLVHLPTDLDPTPFAFTITGIAMGWSIYRYRLMDIVPVAHHFVIESIGDAIMVLDEKNRIVDINPAALRIAGLSSPALAIGRLVRDVVPAATDLAEKFREVPEASVEISFGQAADGSRRDFQMRITPLRNRHGDLIGRLFVLHEITDLKRASVQIQAQNDVLLRTNRELDVARVEAEAASKLKTEFLATISHELRTPLNSVIGYADLMLTIMLDELTPKQRDYIQRIMSNGERLLTLINDILDLSKIEAGRLDLVIQTVSPGQLLAEVKDQMQTQADQKGLRFSTTLDAALPPALKGDPKRLEQILTNLVNNALRFTEKGGVEIKFERADDAQWRIVVTDTGIGIPPHALEFIFDEFRQVDGSYQRQYGGTGLGLAIVRKLVTLMGGTVRVESELGKGSTFTVQLPLDIAGPAVPETAVPGAAGQAAASQGAAVQGAA